MKYILFTFLLPLFFQNPDISMLNIRIGDNKQVLEKIKLKVEAQEDDMIKYKTEDGNHFSVTSENGKVVYMENDWLQDSTARKPLCTDLQFGKTSLHEIRKKFGTNGFAYTERQAFTADKDLIEFNCFEFDMPNNEILVTITKMPLTSDVTEQNVADKLLLGAIIIADKNYLDKTWGDKKIFDRNYKKIKF